MTDRDYKWQTQLDVGKQGEEVVLRWLKERMRFVQDVRHVPKFRQ